MQNNFRCSIILMFSPLEIDAYDIHTFIATYLYSSLLPSFFVVESLFCSWVSRNRNSTIGLNAITLHHVCLRYSVTITAKCIY